MPPELDLVIPATWALGLTLATVRVAAFLVAAPVLATFLPVPGRLAFVLVTGLFLTSPVELATTGSLVGAAVANALVGAALGFLVALLLALFSVAGDIVDVTANLSIASVFDPTRGGQAAAVGRLFSTTALALFVVSGGLGLLVTTLVWSVEAVPLDGAPRPSGALTQLAVDGISRLMIVGVEVAAPVLAALFVTELALGVGARFAPHANIFLLGLPAKLLVALMTLSASVLLFPTAMDGYLDAARSTAIDALRILGASG